MLNHLGLSLAILAASINFTSFSVQAQNLKLWYDKPATQWEEALPLGNGRLGAMVYGSVAVENIQLNEDTFWAGGPHNNINPAAKQSLPEIRKLIDQGNYVAASDMAEKTITSQGAQGMPYQTAGNLTLSFEKHTAYTDYYRELDLQQAVARTHYQVDEVRFEREIYSSFADQVIVIHLTASQSKALNFTLALSHPDNMPVSADSQKGLLTMQGLSNDHEGIKGQVKLVNLAKIVQSDGNTQVDGKSLKISDATEVVILVSMATNFINYHDVSGDAMARATEYLAKAESKFKNAQLTEQQLQQHVKAYQHYFNRVSLDLGSNDFALEPTDQRIREFPHRFDPAMVALYFQFGRYLLISSSQPGTQAANLQGIWNNSSTPAWDSKYTLNINAQMNYWPAEVTNLTEMHQPFFDLIKDLSVSGQDSAQMMYGARGWMAHHNTDIWRVTGGIDWSWGSWPTSNAWLVQHLWEHYLYTSDKQFLSKVYPILQSACYFFEDFLTKDPKTGWLIVSPSISPENEPSVTGKKIAAGVTLDNQLLFDLFTHSITAAKILNVDKQDSAKWQSIVEQLPPMQIGQYHQLQEWLEDWDDPQDKHRHVSHLYGLFPSNQISPLRTPELFNAAKVSLEQRGDPSTGWSMNWKINLWARLLDGNRALKLIGEQIKPAINGDFESGGTYPNMFDAHPPFQIDGNFGFTSGVAEMLAQSHDGAVYLLPALPTAWTQGEIQGLVMRGGFVLDMRWQKGQLSYLKIESRLGGNLRLRSNSPLPQPQGFITAKAQGNNNNPFYALPHIKPVLKHTALELPQLSLANTYLTDVATDAGQSYEWKWDN
jgi:alpha-L-fucosidase 2